jgi:O-antigen ligase
LTPTVRAFEVARVVLVAALVIGMAVSISLAEIALTVLLVWVLLARRAGVVRSLRWPLLPPIVAFAAWSLVAALVSEWPRESVLALKSLLTLGMIFVVVNALPDPVAVRRFATWLVLALAGAAVIGIVQVASCPEPAATASATTLLEKFLRKCTRARAFYSIYMTLAGVLAMMLVGTLPRLARLGADARWLGPAWVVTGAALALTYVRGAWVGLAAGAVTAAAGLGRRGIVAVVALFLLVGVLIAALPNVRARVETIPDPTNATARDRLVMLGVGLRLAGDHPLAGIGPGNVKRVYPGLVPPEGMRRSTSHLHNTPLQIVVERGFVGLASWLWLFVAFFRRAGLTLARLPADAAGDRALVLGSLAAIVTFLVAGLFEYNFGDTEVLMVALAMMAVPVALAEDGRT